MVRARKLQLEQNFYKKSEEKKSLNCFSEEEKSLTNETKTLINVHLNKEL